MTFEWWNQSDLFCFLTFKILCYLVKGNIFQLLYTCDFIVKNLFAAIWRLSLYVYWINALCLRPKVLGSLWEAGMQLAFPSGVLRSLSSQTRALSVWVCSIVAMRRRPREMCTDCQKCSLAAHIEDDSFRCSLHHSVFKLDGTAFFAHCL